MARTAKTPRLSDIDPTEFGKHVVALVVDHISSLMMQLSIDGWRIPEDTHLLEHEARMLCMYAQRGLVGDWTDHGCAADALVSVCAALYSQAATPGQIGGPDDVDVDPTDEIGIVLLAAQARVRIDRENAVPVRELACVAGVDPDHVRLLGRQGAFAVVDGAVAAKVARRWLGARGVLVEA